MIFFFPSFVFDRTQLIILEKASILYLVIINFFLQSTFLLLFWNFKDNPLIIFGFDIEVDLIFEFDIMFCISQTEVDISIIDKKINKTILNFSILKSINILIKLIKRQ